MSDMFEPSSAGQRGAAVQSPAQPSNQGDGAVFSRLGRQGAEAWEYICYYTAAKLDSAKLSMRQTAQAVALLVLAGIVTAGILIVAGVYVVDGLAEGLGLVLGAAWLGRLVAGLAVLGVFALLIGGALSIAKARSFRQTRVKYEERQRKQQERFGHNVTH